MHGLNFTCTKCGNSTYEVSEFRATGGFFTKVFNVQTKKSCFSATAITLSV